MVLIMALSISSCGQVLITDPMRIMRRMLKNPASLSCSFSLFGLSGFLVERKWPDEPNQPDKQNKPDELDGPDKPGLSHTCAIEVPA